MQQSDQSLINPDQPDQEYSLPKKATIIAVKP